MDAGPPVIASASAREAEAAAPPLVPLDDPPPGTPRPEAPVFGAPPPPLEAKRVVIAKIEADRRLAPHEAVIRAHFGGAVPSPLEAQVTPLGGDRQAVLVMGPAKERKPLLMVLDAKGTLLWTKEKPLAGTRQVVTEMVVAPGPKGEVAMLWCDIPTQLVALRKWAWDGIVLADFEVLEVELCEALAGLYWPMHGWVAVASQHGAARAQLLDERGKRAFGPSGVELPWKARPSSPAAIFVDSETSAMVFQVGDLPKEGGVTALDRLLGMRFDTLGTRLWERPLDLGPAAAERPETAPRSTGGVRVSVRGLAANVTSEGSILAR